MSQLVLNSIYIENSDFFHLRETLKPYQNQKMFLLVDENTRKFCLPILKPALEEYDVFVIEIKSGEINKVIKTCEFIWETLLSQQANRSSILLNLGGGVLTDIGGFVAATFKRGIKFVNIPTTVLGASDAAIGGKTGVDLKMLKNQIGVFAKSEAVFINPVFFKTLPIRQVNSGLAEIIKSALIANKKLWQVLIDSHVLQILDWEKIVNESVLVKTEIVERDPLENGDRKLLNFGHTIGHAIETYSLQNDNDPLFHGEAIAIGMICESYISMKKLALSKVEFGQIVKYLINQYHAYVILPESIDGLIELMLQDKKNTSEQINFTLINKIGKGEIDQYIDEELIRESLSFYSAYVNTIEK